MGRALAVLTFEFRGFQGRFSTSLPDGVRFGLERSYRALARLTPDEDRRIELVDLANAIRPRTLT